MKDQERKQPGQPQDDEQKLADLKKKLDEMAKNPGQGNRDPRGNKVSPGASADEAQENTSAEADPKNRLKSAELQLEEFKKKQFDQEFLKTIGMNEEEYKQFLDGYERMVQRMRDEPPPPEKPAATTAPAPSGPRVNVGDAGVVGARGGPDAAAGTSGGPAYAPPGFSDAKEKFSREALKLKPPPK